MAVLNIQARHAAASCHLCVQASFWVIRLGLLSGRCCGEKCVVFQLDQIYVGLWASQSFHRVVFVWVERGAEDDGAQDSHHAAFADCIQDGDERTGPTHF